MDYFKNAIEQLRTGAIKTATSSFGNSVKGLVNKGRNAAETAAATSLVESTTGKKFTAEEKSTIGEIFSVTGSPSNLLGKTSQILSIFVGLGFVLVVSMLGLYTYSVMNDTSMETLSFMKGTATNAFITTIVFTVLCAVAIVGLSFSSALGPDMRSTLNYSFLIGLSCGLISLVWWQIAKKVDSGTVDETVAEDVASALSSDTYYEGFQVKEAQTGLAAADSTFLNSQPLSIKQAGYLGSAGGGQFKPEEAVTQALRAGFRSFVLKIDYLDAKKDSSRFEKPGEPTLLYTTDGGAILSSNSGSIEKVAKAIYDVAFTQAVPNSTQPVLLYLHLNRAPNPAKEPEKYTQFLSKIAKQLGPLTPYHLGLTPLGVFHRQKSQDTLLMSPLKGLEGHVIIASNANTDIFRMGRKGSKAKPYAPAEDLDYWVNLRVYLESDEQSIGITQMPPDEKQARAVVVPISKLLAFQSTPDNPKAGAFASKGKMRYVIAMPDAKKNPTQDEMDYLLNTLGVNMIPLDIFGDDLATVKSLVKLYNGSSYRTKPAVLQKMTP
jgi:hypothetical protein